jgi:hypothetical protein
MVLDKLNVLMVCAVASSPMRAVRSSLVEVQKGEDMKQNYHVNANTNSHYRAIIRCADTKLSGFVRVNKNTLKINYNDTRVDITSRNMKVKIFAILLLDLQTNKCIALPIYSQFTSFTR